MTATAEQIARYQHLRQVCIQVNNHLVKQLPKDAAQEGGKQLGMLRRGILVFGSENEMSVLMDFCIHDVRHQGRTLIEEVCAQPPFPPGSDELLMLLALREARFSIFLVEALTPGAGAHLRDLFRGESFFLYDRGLSTSAVPGMIVPFRVFCVEGMWMTTGAPLPAVKVAKEQDAEQIFAYFEQIGKAVLARADPLMLSDLTAHLIRNALAHQAGAEGGAGMPEVEEFAEHPEPVRRIAPRVGRNDPCPCGSGRKFKQCCMRK